MFKIEKFAKMIGLSSQTLRRWSESDNEDLLKPCKVVNRYRYYSYKQYVDYVGVDNIEYDMDGNKLKNGDDK